MSNLTQDQLRKLVAEFNEQVFDFTGASPEFSINHRNGHIVLHYAPHGFIKQLMDNGFRCHLGHKGMVIEDRMS